LVAEEVGMVRAVWVSIRNGNRVDKHTGGDSISLKWVSRLQGNGALAYERVQQRLDAKATSICCGSCDFDVKDDWLLEAEAYIEKLTVWYSGSIVELKSLAIVGLDKEDGRSCGSNYRGGKGRRAG
jgi:hypothetical protein